MAGCDQYHIAGRLNIYRDIRDSMACIVNLKKKNSNAIAHSGSCTDGVEECGQAVQGPGVTESLLEAFRYALKLRLKYLSWKCFVRLHTLEPYVTRESR